MDEKTRQNDRIVPVFKQGVTMWQKCDARVRVRVRVRVRERV